MESPEPVYLGPHLCIQVNYSGFAGMNVGRAPVGRHNSLGENP